MHGVPTPWCGHLTGRVDPSACSLTVVPSEEEEGGGGAAADAACCATLQLTLAKPAGSC